MKSRFYALSFAFTVFVMLVLTAHAGPYDYVPPGLQNIDTSRPTGTESIAYGDDAIRQTRRATVEWAQVEHNLDGTHNGAFCTYITNTVNTLSAQQAATAINAISYAGHQVGFGYASSTAQVTVTAQYANGSIPQVSGGTQLLQFTYTPKFSGSILYIEGDVNCYPNNESTGYPVVALFTSASANAISAWRYNSYGQYSPYSSIHASAFYVTISTSPLTIQMRAGNGGSGHTTYFNQTVWGTGLPMYLVVHEYKQ